MLLATLPVLDRVLVGICLWRIVLELIWGLPLFLSSG